MSLERGPIGLDRIGTIFEREISNLQGAVRNRYVDHDILLARAVLPAVETMQKNDQISAGIALRIAGANAAVYPYTFRQVCSNGAIMAWTVGSWEIDLEEKGSEEAAEEALVDAIHACAQPEVFEDVTRHLRNARHEHANLVLTLLPMLDRFPQPMMRRLLSQITERFHADGDSSRYGLFNAVTAVARTTSDPETRWQLEMIGGHVAHSGRETADSLLSARHTALRV